jgi:hypothetical protein
MKKFLLLSLLALSCATASNVYYEPVSSEVAHMKPKNPSQVPYYMMNSRPNKKYQIVGYASVPLDSKCDTPEKCYKALCREAAKRGADAVIDITYQTDEQEVTRISGGNLGRAGGFSGYSGLETKHVGYRGIVVIWEE